MKKTRYVVFNYTDNIFASPDVYDTKKEAKEFIKQFRKRFDKQGYYKTNTWEKINPAHIDLEILDEGFSPFAKGGLTPAKAQKMLDDGEANGKPLTDKQKRYFGAVANQDKPSRMKIKKEASL